MKLFAPIAFGLSTTLALPAMSQDADILAAAEAQKEPYLETLKNLVNTDSGTGYVEGLSAVEAVLTERLAARGLAVETRPSEELGGNTIIGTKTGTGDKNILLMVHYDTVFGEGTAAERPFTVAEGRATGPGVGDAKGGVAVILHTVDLLDGLGFDGYGQLTVLLNPDEEMDSSARASSSASLRPGRITPCRSSRPSPRPTPLR